MPTPALRVLLPLLAVASAGACTHEFGIEGRETPVHVWLTAPDLARQGGTLTALVYVGAEKAVEGPVRFPPGTPHVALPTLYLPAGAKTVSVVLAGGARSAREEIRVRGETWVQVIVRERSIRIRQSDEEPRFNVGQDPPRPTTRLPSPSGR